MRTNAKQTALLVAILFALLLDLAVLAAILFFHLPRPRAPLPASAPSAILDHELIDG